MKKKITIDIPIYIKQRVYYYDDEENDKIALDEEEMLKEFQNKMDNIKKEMIK